MVRRVGRNFIVKVHSCSVNLPFPYCAVLDVWETSRTSKQILD